MTSQQVDNLTIRTPIRQDETALIEGLEQIGQLVPIVVNRSTKHILNPSIAAAYKASELTEYPILFVTVDPSDETAASIILAGGFNGNLRGYVETDRDEYELLTYLSQLYFDPAQRVKLLALGGSADYYINYFAALASESDAPPPSTRPSAPQAILEPEFMDIPALDLVHAPTREETRVSWQKWRSIAQDEPHEGAFFYVDDDRMKTLVQDPRKLFATGCSVAVEPNISITEYTPGALAAANVWYKRSISRMWAQEGIKILIDLNVPIRYMKINLSGVPLGFTAYANRYHAGEEGHLIEAYRIAQQHAGTEDIIYIVFGTPGARKICAAHNWQYVEIPAQYAGVTAHG